MITWTLVLQIAVLLIVATICVAVLAAVAQQGKDAAAKREVDKRRAEAELQRDTWRDAAVEPKPEKTENQW